MKKAPDQFSYRTSAHPQPHRPLKNPLLADFPPIKEKKYTYIDDYFRIYVDFLTYFRTSVSFNLSLHPQKK